MSFKLKHRRHLAGDFRKALRKELTGLIDRIAPDQVRVDAEDIHSVRKGLKRIRAALRLVRCRIGRKEFKRQNAHYRDIGRRLSAARDFQVLAQTVAELKDHEGTPEQTEALGKLERCLKRNHARADIPKQPLRIQLARRLKSERTRIEELPLKNLSWKDCRKGLRRMESRSRKKFKAARGNPTDQDMHEWRKLLKYLGYQLGFCRRIGPEKMAGKAKQALKMAELLGDDHDLAMLHRFASSAELSHAGSTAVSKMVERRRKYLQNIAVKKATQFYH